MGWKAPHGGAAAPLARRVLLVGAVAAGLCGLAASVPGVASAYVNACPTAPATYGGTDAVVAELRALRIEQVASCVALRERLDTSNQVAGTTSDGALTTSPSTNSQLHWIKQTDTDVQGVSSRLGSGYVAGAPCPTSLTIGINGLLCAIRTNTDRGIWAQTPRRSRSTARTPRQSSPSPARAGMSSGGGGTTDVQPVVDAVNAAGTANHSDVWFLIGLLAAGLPAYGLYRLVMPCLAPFLPSSTQRPTRRR